MSNYERLALEIIAQAIRDTRAGDQIAAEWLLSTGASWLEMLGHEARDTWRDWVAIGCQ